MPLPTEGSLAPAAGLPGIRSGRYARTACPDVRELRPGDGP